MRLHAEGDISEVRLHAEEEVTKVRLHAAGEVSLQSVGEVRLPAERNLRYDFRESVDAHVGRCTLHRRWGALGGIR